MKQRDLEELISQHVQRTMLMHGDCPAFPSLSDIKSLLKESGNPRENLIENSWLFRHAALVWDHVVRQSKKQNSESAPATKIGNMLNEAPSQWNPDVEKRFSNFQEQQRRMSPADQVMDNLKPPAAPQKPWNQTLAGHVAIGAGSAAVVEIVAQAMKNPQIKAALDQLKAGGAQAFNTMQQSVRMALINLLNQIASSASGTAQKMQPKQESKTIGSMLNGINELNSTQLLILEHLVKIDELTPEQIAQIHQKLAAYPGGAGGAMASPLTTPDPLAQPTYQDGPTGQAQPQQPEQQAGDAPSALLSGGAAPPPEGAAALLGGGGINVPDEGAGQTGTNVLSTIASLFQTHLPHMLAGGAEAAEDPTADPEQAAVDKAAKNPAFQK